MVRPIKKLGQNFLIDKNITRKIISAFKPQGDDIIIEIGPGRGALTEKLYEVNKNLIAIEIDKNISEELKQKFPDLHIIQKDVLNLDFEKELKFDKKLRIIGNIPYYITSQILIKFFDNNELINDALIMMQYEVAKRITAKPASKDYGILSVFSQFYSEPKILFNVSQNVFYPKPNVDSAVVHFIFEKKFELNAEGEKNLRLIVKTAFNQRRKTLRNSLQKLINDQDQSKIEFNFLRRAEELSLNDFIYLAKNFSELKS